MHSVCFSGEETKEQLYLQSLPSAYVREEMRLLHTSVSPFYKLGIITLPV